MLPDEYLMLISATYVQHRQDEMRKFICIYNKMKIKKVFEKCV
jgi:hypothetical protein